MIKFPVNVNVNNLTFYRNLLTNSMTKPFVQHKNNVNDYVTLQIL